MNNQERANVKFATKNLIICFICYVMISQFVIGGIINYIIEDYSLMFQVVVQLIYQAIIIFIIWKIAFFRVMNNCTITANEASHIFRNILIFSAIVFLISLWFNISTDFKKIDEISTEAHSSTVSMYYSQLLNEVISMDDYFTALEDAKNKIYVILIMREIGFLIIIMGIGYLQKNELKKRTI